MQQYTYLLVNFFTIIICFIFSFDRRIRFDRFFKAFGLAALITAVPFIAWDVWFTDVGVWWFDTRYTLGIRLAGLPVEEWLFFICIPFSCTFTYFCLGKFFNLSWANGFNNMIAFATCITCILVALLFPFQLYTFVTVVSAALVMIFLHFIARVVWIGEASLIYFCLMPGFFMVNGILTGTGLQSPIVNYNPQEILNIRMLTIPVEDAIYGYTQFMLIIYFFKMFAPGRVSPEAPNATQQSAGPRLL